MATLEELLAQRIRVLRTEKGWSQARLSDAARRLGLKWSAGAVGLIETGGQRADRLLDVAMLCWVFDVSVDKLLVGDDLVDLPSGEQVPLANIRNALTGQVQDEVRGRAEVTRFGADDPEELARIGRKIGLDAHQMRGASADVFDTLRFLQARDRRAGITPDMPQRTAQAKRGHATRAMLGELQEVIARDGVDVVVNRGITKNDNRVRRALGQLGHQVDD